MNRLFVIQNRIDARIVLTIALATRPIAGHDHKLAAPVDVLDLDPAIAQKAFHGALKSLLANALCIGVFRKDFRGVDGTRPIGKMAVLPLELSQEPKEDSFGVRVLVTARGIRGAFPREATGGIAKHNLPAHRWAVLLSPS